MLSKTGFNLVNPCVRYKNYHSLTEYKSINNYLGVQLVKYESKGTLVLKHKFLSEQILEAVDFEKEITTISKPTPVMNPLLHKDLDVLSRKFHCNYRSLVGMHGYLQNFIRLDIFMLTHQYARFNNNPKILKKKT